MRNNNSNFPVNNPHNDDNKIDHNRHPCVINPCAEEIIGPANHELDLKISKNSTNNKDKHKEGNGSSNNVYPFDFIWLYTP